MRQIVSFRAFGPKRALSYKLWCEELMQERSCKAGLNLPVLQREAKRRSLVHPQPPADGYVVLAARPRPLRVLHHGTGSTECPLGKILQESPQTVWCCLNNTNLGL